MSTFGSHTPAEELKDAILGVQSDFNLSDEDLAVLLVVVLNHITNPYDANFDRIQHKQKEN